MPYLWPIGSYHSACKSKSQKIHSVEEPEASQLDLPSDPFSLSVFGINAENNGIEVPVELNGIHLLMELDWSFYYLPGD